MMLHAMQYLTQKEAWADWKDVMYMYMYASILALQYEMDFQSTFLCVKVV